MIYLASYDLHNEKNYERIEAAITEEPLEDDERHSSHRVLFSVWLIDTPESLAVWRDRLRAAIDEDDAILVSWVESRSALVGYMWRNGTNAWLSSSERRWR